MVKHFKIVKLKTVYFLSIIIVWLTCKPVYCEFQTETHLIDIPTAYISLARLTAGINASFTTKEDPWPQALNSYFQLQVFNRFHLGLSIFTKEVQAMDVKCQIIRETQHVPAIAIGSDYISAHKYISPVSAGPGVGWDDDETYAQRNSEQLSLYLVATKDFGPYGIYTLGIGRGCWVGYGTRSYLFNSDIFSNEFNNDALGLIWGGEVLLSEPVFGTIDFDGRDFNIGIKIRNEFWQVGLAAAKIEHRLKGAPILYPRFAFGASINTLFSRHILRPPMGTLIVTVTNAATGQPMYANISFPGSAITPLRTKRETGSATLYLKPGTYWVRAGSLGTYWTERKVFISSGVTTVAHFDIKPLM